VVHSCLLTQVRYFLIISIRLSTFNEKYAIHFLRHPGKSPPYSRKKTEKPGKKFPASNECGYFLNERFSCPAQRSGKRLSHFGEEIICFQFFQPFFFFSKS